MRYLFTIAGLLSFCTGLVRFFLTLGISCFLLLFFCFMVSRSLPIDPAARLAGEGIAQEQYMRLRSELGLDESLLWQFRTYIQALLRGDWGISSLTGRSVLDDIKRVFPATAELAFFALLIGVPSGIVFGVLAAARKNSFMDQMIRLSAMMGHCLPVFWIGALLLHTLYGEWGWVGGAGRLDAALIPGSDGSVPMGFILIGSLRTGDMPLFRDAFSHIVLPGLLLGLFCFAHISRMTRSFMLRELSQDYILAARARAIPERRILWFHALRNVAGSLTAVLIWSVAHLLEGAIVTETVFSWPGLGYYSARALLNSDVHALLGAVLVGGGLFMGFSLLADFFQNKLFPQRLLPES